MGGGGCRIISRLIFREKNIYLFFYFFLVYPNIAMKKNRTIPDMFNFDV